MTVGYSYLAFKEQNSKLYKAVDPILNNKPESLVPIQ